MTYLLIGITALFSIAAFSQRELLYKYQFNPYQITKRKQYLRLLLHGFLHANWVHLLVNMIVLLSFGRALEAYFLHMFGSAGSLLFLLLYLTSIVISPIYSLIRRRNDYLYNAVGASGAVSAVVFADIVFNPWDKILFFGILPIPGILFAVLYLLYSWQMSRRQGDNIAHDAHFTGAVYGFIFPFLFKPDLVVYFAEQFMAVFQ